MEMTEATLAEVLEEVDRVAPIKFAIRVLAAIEIGKGIWKVRPVKVASTDCAARCVVPR